MQRFNIRNEALQTEFNQDGTFLQQSLPKDIGTGYSKVYQLDKEFNYIETQYTLVKDISILSRIEQLQPHLVLTLGLKGHSRFVNSYGRELPFKQGFASISTFQSISGKRQFQSDSPTHQLRFSIGKIWLKNLFGESDAAQLLDHKKMRLLSCQPISPQGVLAVQQLINPNIANEMMPVYRKGLAMTVLCTELNHLLLDSKQIASKYNQQDKNIAMLARDILFNEFMNPPSVADLANRVGTNQFKLKKLFHQFFNDTPYGLLLEFRMNYAYRLLKTDNCNVSVAAYSVGYRYASNFSAAFTKYFGVSPKIISKHR